VTVDELIDIVSAIAGKKLVKRHDLSKPQGVRGRNSDNTLLNKILGWEPAITLEDGLASTYRWIESQLHKTGKICGSH
jgi:GDP-D-mannose 3', 5'-epimerase